MAATSEVVMVVVAAVLLLLSPGEAQGRSRQQQATAHPHGLPFESPLALSPAAYEFFHSGDRARRRRAGAPAPALSPRGQLTEESVARGADRLEEGGGVASVNPARRGVALRAGAASGVFGGGAVVVLLAALVLAYAVARRRVAHGDDAEAPGAVKSKS